MEEDKVNPIPELEGLSFQTFESFEQKIKEQALRIRDTSPKKGINYKVSCLIISIDETQVLTGNEEYLLEKATITMKNNLRNKVNSIISIFTEVNKQCELKGQIDFAKTEEKFITGFTMENINQENFSGGFSTTELKQFLQQCMLYSPHPYQYFILARRTGVPKCLQTSYLFDTTGLNCRIIKILFPKPFSKFT